MARAATTSDVFNAVAEPQRRALLMYLGARERAVSEIAAALKLGQPSVSKHLRVLREVDLVRVRRAGREKLYQANAAAIGPLREWAGRAGNLEGRMPTIADQLIAEFEEQAPLTRKFLERLPEDRLGWRPHERSRTAGELALHLARVPGAIARFVHENPAQAPNFNQQQVPATLAEVLAAHDEGAGIVRSELSRLDDRAMQELWRMKMGDHELFAIPRARFLRNVMLNHWYQHRGQFSVYLRMMDIPVPATFGPSADERPTFL